MAHVRNGKEARKERQDAGQVRREDSVQAPKDRLAILDLRLGKNVGAVKERARLAAML